MAIVTVCAIRSLISPHSNVSIDFMILIQIQWPIISYSTTNIDPNIDILEHLYIQLYFSPLRYVFSGITLIFMMLFLIFESKWKIPPRQVMASKLFAPSLCSLSSVKEYEI